VTLTDSSKGHSPLEIGTVEGVFQGLQVTDISFENFNVQPLDGPPVCMDQNTGRTTLSQQGAYQTGTGMSGGPGYNYSHLQVIISQVTGK
jgi:hypothetical protein